MATDQFVHWTPRREFLARLVSSYRVANEMEYGRQAGLIWSKITAMREDVHDALINDKSELADLLAHPLTTNMYYGVDNYCRDIQGKSGATHPSTYERIAGWTDQMVQVLGAKRLWHPHPNFGDPPPIGDPVVYAQALIEELSKTLRFEVRFPEPFPNEEGLRVSQGLLTYRALHSLYQAQRMREQSPPDYCAWLEIGAGMGRVAQFAWQMGQRNFTIVDLPLAVIGQACFLAATVGEENIRLPGESFDYTDEKVKLLTPQELFARGTFYDVVLNADSLTEMSREYAEQYVMFLTKHASVLISINHERNIFAVKDLLKPHSRNLYPLRGGYVEELFYFRNASGRGAAEVLL